MNKRKFFAGLMALLLIFTMLPFQNVKAAENIGQNTGLERPVFTERSYEGSVESSAEVKMQQSGQVEKTFYASRDFGQYGTDYYRNQLSGTEQAFYDRLEDACEYILNSSVDVEDTGDILGEGLTQTQIYNVIHIFVASNPQYYFLSNNYFWSSRTINGTTQHYGGIGIYSDFRSGTARSGATTQFFNTIDGYVSQIMAETTAYSRIKKAHDIVCKTVMYELNIYDQSAYSAVVQQVSVCAGYAKMFQILTNAAGYETLYVTSYDHAWNQVLLDGAWYAVDTTWDDPAGGFASVDYLDYFLITDSALCSGNSSHTPESIWSGIRPACTTVYAGTGTSTLISGLRVAGNTRYETAIQCAKTMQSGNWNTVVLACADNFPDALAGCTLAVEKNAPILLVGASAEGTNQTMNYLYSNLNSGATVYLLGGTNAISSSVETSLRNSGRNVIRLGGATRYETNMQIINAMNITTGTDIVIASGTGYADSLSVSGIAGARNMPIFLAGDSLTSDEINKIRALSPAHIYIIGGTMAVNTNVENQARSLCSQTVRISGSTRYETSIAVANYFGMKLSSSAVVAYGANFPDGLTGGVLAAKTGAPVLLVADDNYLNQKSFLDNSSVLNLYVMGGTSVISDSTLTKLTN